MKLNHEQQFNFIILPIILILGGVILFSAISFFQNFSGSGIQGGSSVNTSGSEKTGTSKTIEEIQEAIENLEEQIEILKWE